MANRVKYGLKSVYYAVCTVDAVTNVATYGTPKPWPGAVSLSLDAEGGTTKFRADNIDYWVGQSNNGYSGDFESALIPDDFRVDILGEVSPTGHDGVLIEDAGALTKYFALLFQFEGDDSATRHVMYKCSATRPSVSGQTTDEEIEPQTETLTLTATAIHNATLDKDIVKARCAADDSAYGSWFSAVYQPTGSSTTT
jgi:phi13 family phage major tail protein